MTPFEASGYTKDTKFKTLVEVYNLPIGTLVRLHEDDGTSCPFFKTVLPQKHGSLCYYLPNMGIERQLEVYVEEPVLPLGNYPNPRHKHADVIIEWAEGAEIEYKSDTTGLLWETLSYPNFNGAGEYRVKPSKSQKQIEKEALQEQLAKIEQETATLKQQLSKLGE